MPFYCCVPNCFNSNRDYTMHSFPGSRHEMEYQRYMQWIQAVGRIDIQNEPREVVVRKYRVCDCHFAEEARFEITRGHTFRSKLKRSAIPTLLLSPQPDFEPGIHKKEILTAGSCSSNISEHLPAALSISTPSSAKDIQHEEGVEIFTTSQMKLSSTISPIVQVPECSTTPPKVQVSECLTTPTHMKVPECSTTPTIMQAPGSSTIRRRRKGYIYYVVKVPVDVEF